MVTDPFLMPVQSATFVKTTAAKKISTNEFRPGGVRGDDAGRREPGEESLKYESIVNIPQMPTSQIQLPSDNVLTVLPQF